MIRLIKDSTGKIIAFGPADENYQPIIPQGGMVIDDATIQYPPSDAFIAQFKIDNGLV